MHGARATAHSVSMTDLVNVQSSSGGSNCLRSGADEVEPEARESALSMGVLRRGQSEPPLHPLIVSLHVEQTTPEAIGLDIMTRASSSPDEHGSVEPRQDEPSPTRPRANEPDPRDPCRVSGPPQIIINHGRHAIVASDLSRQIHGELHTSQLGTFSGGICR